MIDHDQLLRAYALLSSLRANIPEAFEVPENWAHEFNAAVTKIEHTVSKDLSEFKVGDRELKQSVASSNYISGEILYRKGLWCNRANLMLKVDAVLNYLQVLRDGQGWQAH
ncbi:MAG: hypothetical protein WC986_08655 [Elusimicrobiota bacterium]|jgi:hypothetical protein